MKRNFFVMLSNPLLKLPKQVLVVCLFLFLCTTPATAFTTYYSKMTVKVESGSTGNGKVYVSTEKNPATIAYGTEMVATQDGSSQSQKYYLFAQANNGFYHVGWSANNNASAEANSNKSPYERIIMQFLRLFL